MSRAFDFVVVGVVIIISVCIHLIGLNLFAPGSPLYELAAGATNLNAAKRADQWYQILTVWVPMIASFGIIAWAFIREYRRQAVTAAQPVR